MIEPALRTDNQAMTDTTKRPSERLGERIAELIKKSRKTSVAIAKQCGVTPQAVNGWKKTGRISKDMLQVLAGVLEVDMAEFFGGTEQWPRRLREARLDADGLFGAQEEDRRTSARRETDLPPPSNDEIVIPQYRGLGGSMGHGLLLRDQPGEIQGWRVTPEWVRQNVKNHSATKNLRIVTGFGDSMRPLYNPGDPLLVDAGIKSVDFDSIYFFRIGEEGFIKRLQRVPGQGLLAISENKSYRDWVITPDMDFEVFARIIKVWCGSDF